MRRVRIAQGAWPVAACAFLQWLVLARAPFLPFVDLPQHIAQAALLLHRSDPGVAGLYEVRLWPQVNVLALFVLAAFRALMPEAVAVRALLALYVAGLAAALWYLTRVLRTSGWAAAAALLFTIQFNLWYGFISFCVGLPLLIWLIARWASALPDDATDLPPVPTARSFVADAVLWWLVLLAHTLLFAFGLTALAAWSIAIRRSLRAAALRMTAVRVAAAVPSVIWFFAWQLDQRWLVRAVFPGTGAKLDALWEGVTTKLSDLPRALLVASQPGRIESVVLIGVGLVVLALVRSELRGDGVTRRRTWVRVVAWLGLAAYAGLPYSLYDRDHVTYGLFILYQRFAFFLPLLLLPTFVGPARVAWRRGLAFAIAVAHIALALHWGSVLRDVGAQARGLDATIDAMQPGRRLKSLVYAPYPHGLRYEAFLHVASYYQARKLGETDQSFAALLPSPVHYRDPRRPYLSLDDEHLRPQEFRASDASRYDYLFLYAADSSGAPPRWQAVSTDSLGR